MPEIFNKYDHMVFNTIWKLSPGEESVLDSISTIGYYNVREFLPNVYTNYNISYQDRIKFGENEFQVHYNFTSRHHLEWLMRNKPLTKVIFQLRINRANKYYGCLVRPLP